MNHVMIDLETLGQYGNAIVTSVNAVQFDIETGVLGRTFSQPVSIKNSIKQGLKIDSDTLMWWLRQSEEARKKLIEDDKIGQPLYEVLKNFAFWLNNLPTADLRSAIEINKVFVWGRGPRFDMGILSNHYHSFQMNIPWSFRNELCVRTYEFIHPIIKERVPREGIEHDGVADAKHQIKYVVAVHNFITEAKRGNLNVWK